LAQNGIRCLQSNLLYGETEAAEGSSGCEAPGRGNESKFGCYRRREATLVTRGARWAA
jgi:hypothetical protein